MREQRMTGILVMAVFTAQLFAIGAATSVEAQIPPVQKKEVSSVLRKCVLIGMSMCGGDAQSSVKCDGYKKPHQLADDQALSSLTLDFYVAKSDKVVAGWARIDGPRAALNRYDFLLDWEENKSFKELLLKDKIDGIEEPAAQDLWKAFRNHKPGVEISRDGKDHPLIGSFEIPAAAPLFRKCYKDGGVVDPANE